MVKKVLTDVHRYWFGELKSPTDFPADRTAIWFRPTVEIDNDIRDTFGKYLEAAKATEWDVPHLSREEQVALVILLDQFPRQIFRASSQSFAYDAKALAAARALIDAGIERFYWAERMFLAVVLEHPEDIATQDFSVMVHAELAVTAPEALKVPFRSALDFATKHRDVIRKFGRFPHRNALIGRESTPEEVEFLKGGRGF